MKKYSDIVIMIPALNPDFKLINTLKEIKQAGFTNVILVNDGSKEECDNIFSEAESLFSVEDCKIKILKHSVNLGQGRAYKTAFNYYISVYKGGGVVQCDADGQHHINDIVRCADLLLENPDKFILGVRNFNSKDIPFRSRFGNKCTNLVFKLFCGMSIRDTQTGLKGIPYELTKKLIETPGERFEYATSVLLEVNKLGIDMIQFDINTIYINENESSHFNPLVDSIRIYSLIFKYLLSSLSAFLVDIVLFTIFINIFAFSSYYIILSTYCAKVFSCTYTFFVNKKLVFSNNDKVVAIACKFVILCVVQSSLSALFVTACHDMLQLNETFIKILVDTILFFFSFQVQKRWVFKRTKKYEMAQK